MIRKILAALMILICITAFASCAFFDPDRGDASARTTITADEWNKHAEMDNYTAILELPDYKIYSKATENVIEEGDLNDDPDALGYYVKESDHFYEVRKHNGLWCKMSEQSSLSVIASAVRFFFIDTKLEDLVYDSNNRTYVGHTLIDGEEICATYRFENGVIVSIKHSSPSWDYEAIYYFSDIGTTKVTAPEYIEVSTFYALEVMPGGGSFKRMDISSYSLPASIKEAHKATNGGYVFIVQFNGYVNGNIAVIGVDGNGEITGTKIIECYDVYGWKYEEWDATGYFNGASLGNIDNVDVVSGCTLSSRGYRNAVKDALESARILNSY